MRGRLRCPALRLGSPGSVLAAFLVATIVVGALPPGAAVAAGVQSVAAGVRSVAAGGQYVALGDSYAAGLGITPPATNPPAPGCGQSGADYPHQVAAALGLDLIDRTCSGAVTKDLAGSQQVGGAPVAPQLDSLTSSTRLVTLTIGGNDLGFSAIAAYCASLAGPAGPVLGGGQQLATCTEHYVSGGTDSLRAKIQDTVAPAVAAVLAAIAQRAPQAKIVVVDYPAIVPDPANTPTGGCWSSPVDSANSLPFTDADLPYLAQIEARLDDALATAATAAGAAVAQVYPQSLAHTACSQAPWVNGVRVAGLSLTANSLHPNSAGAAAMAAAATPVARTVLAGGTAAAPVDVAPASGGSGVPGWVWAVVAIGLVLLLIVMFGVLRVRRRNNR